MEYASVYDLIAEKFSVRTALYPGAADDMTPSLSIPYVAYIDKSSFSADFFRDKDALLQKLDRLKHYEEPCTFDFYAEDYNSPLELPQFDLLISRYAGNVGQAMPDTTTWEKISESLVAGRMPGESSTRQ